MRHQLRIASRLEPAFRPGRPVVCGGTWGGTDRLAGSMLQTWKLAVAAALLGGIMSALVPRDSATTVQALIAARPPQTGMLDGEIEVLRPNRFLLRDRTGAIR